MDLKPDSQTPLSHVLAGKARGTSTLSVRPDITVAAAVEVLNHNQVGSVLVMDGTRLIGIFTERDILRRVVGERRDPASTRVSEVMTRDLVVMRPSSSVVDAMRVISEKRIRHVPVVDGATVVGVVSQGDLNHWLVRNREGQIQDLVDYVTGRYPT
jgi:CBS domain-containing protein